MYVGPLAQAGGIGATKCTIAAARWRESRRF